MAEQTELDWDHAGENLEENPLLAGFKTGYSTFYCDQRTGLTYGQTEQLLNTLDDASAILRSYMSGLEQPELYERPVQNMPCGNCCSRISAYSRLSFFFMWLFYKITGAKTIIFTVALQVLNIFILSVIDIWPEKNEKTVVIVSSITMIVLHVFNLLLVLLTSAHLAQQLWQRKVSGILLIQSYIATVLLFSGIYTMTYRMKPHSWKFVYEDINQDPVLIIVLYLKFLYYSVSTATLCGSANAIPKEWYNCFFASLQMLLSFMYFASILGRTFSPPLQENVQRIRSRNVPRRRTVSLSGDSQFENSEQIHNEQVRNYGSIAT